LNKRYFTQNQANNYETRYEIDIRPMVIEKSTGKILYVGPFNQTDIRIGDTSTWEMDLQGTITFPDNLLNMVFFDGDTPSALGQFKVGLFKTADVSAAGDYLSVFTPETLETFTPLMKNGSPVVLTLGTALEIRDNKTVSFSFDDLSNADEIFEKHTYYEMIVWYDNSSESLNTDAIDTANGSYLEGYYFIPIQYQYSPAGMIINNWKDGFDWKLIQGAQTEYEFTMNLF
jgi:hypothetical protein